MSRPVSSVLPGAGTAPGAAVDGGVSAGPRYAELLKAYAKSDTGRYDYLLVFRFAVINLVGFALLVAAYFEGWIGDILAADSTNLCIATFAVFLGGLGICAARIRHASVELNYIKSVRRPPTSRVAKYLADIDGRSADSRSIIASSLRLKLFSRISPVRHAANSLVFLGLIGTVVGFIMALSVVEPSSAADPSSIGPMVTNLIAGMSVALYTTLVGAVLNVWLMLNYQVLATGTVNLVTATVELGERNAKH